MCLGVPVKIVEVNDKMGKAEIGGVLREVNLSFMEDIKIGDYILMHAGFAIQKMDEEEAMKTLTLINEVLDSYEVS